MNYAQFIRQRFVIDKKKIPKSGVTAPLILLLIKFGHANRPRRVNISHRRAHVHQIYTCSHIHVLQQVVELLAPFHYV